MTFTKRPVEDFGASEKQVPFIESKIEAYYPFFEALVESWKEKTDNALYKKIVSYIENELPKKGINFWFAMAKKPCESEAKDTLFYSFLRESGVFDSDDAFYDWIEIVDPFE